ncbi:MAG: Gfo/Idh/MocA family oxidoreductase [Deltaproteobacteria bacterium]|nr:MAG: Gfo/Idh/MocA family oxidoreductase [Deltaproteobacteria bacterium]
MDRIKVGVVGCGVISEVYLKVSRIFEDMEVSACSDIIMDRAKARAQEFNIPKACTVKEMLNDPEIRIVINLTVPNAHAEIALKVLEAGKSVYNEKPLAVTREDGKKILRTAKERKLKVGAAPDTFLGGGLQTCRKLIDDGWIGEPVAATAFMMTHGPEGWHPDPEFFYKMGGGSMFDMGPYYLTALVFLLGPVNRVTSSTRISFPERIVTSKPKYGTRIKVDVPTHIAGIMDFANGTVGTIITSFDVWGAQLPHIEIYGTEGSLSVPDPNRFSGPISILRAGSKEWKEVPFTHGYTEQSRSIGVADMAKAMKTERPHRASGELAYHVLDIMHAFHDASSQGKHIELESTCKRPAPLPIGLRHGQLDV